MDESLIQAYLEEFNGDWYGYLRWTRREAQRPGQAFFNALNPYDQTRLRGSIRDPFYKDNIDILEDTILWLISN